jgi:hypothetical protein
MEQSREFEEEMILSEKEGREEDEKKNLPASELLKLGECFREALAIEKMTNFLRNFLLTGMCGQERREEADWRSEHCSL